MEGISRMAGIGFVCCSIKCLIVAAIVWLIRITATSSRAVKSLNACSIACCVVSAGGGGGGRTEQPGTSTEQAGAGQRAGAMPPAAARRPPLRKAPPPPPNPETPRRAHVREIARGKRRRSKVRICRPATELGRSRARPPSAVLTPGRGHFSRPPPLPRPSRDALEPSGLGSARELRRGDALSSTIKKLERLR